jgi:adenine deaminase
MKTRHDLVAAARGDLPLDLLIKNGSLVNVLTGKIEKADIGLLGNRIACVVPSGSITYSASKEIDAAGFYIVPGFIDGHVHNESSMVTPAQWAKLLLQKGTTTVFTDPHEITNVFGLKGIQYMLDASQGIHLRYFVTAPSCVPGVPSIETAGATLTAKEMTEVLSWNRVVAVAEAMDFQNLIKQTGNITPIVEAGHDKGVPIEGHAPFIIGQNLQAYVAAIGPSSSDHESQGYEEMLEKVKAGMMVYSRASTFLDGTPEIVKAMREVADTRMLGVCTDDVMPHHLLNFGHLDYSIRRLIMEGVNPVIAFQMATINVAQHYGIKGLGAIAPGWLADIVVLKDLENVIAEYVIADGKIVVDEGKLVVDIQEPVPPILINSVQIPEITEESFVPMAPIDSGNVTVNAIEMCGLLTDIIQVEIPCRESHVIFPLPAGLTIASVIPRHGQNTSPSLAIVSGYPLKDGAVASSVSHDSHNLIVIGTNPYDMYVAIKRMVDIGGGFVAAKSGKVIGEVALPIAGLMSTLTVEDIAKEIQKFEDALPLIGLASAIPFALMLLALPVIPKARITDKGIADVFAQHLIPFFA